MLILVDLASILEHTYREREREMIISKLVDLCYYVEQMAQPS